MLSVVIPAYREAGRIGATVAAARRAAAALDQPFEILVVDDGSDDGTAEAAGAADRVIRLPRNQGKGAALSRGLAEARGEWLVMLDADLGDTADQFPRLLTPIQSGAADMTIALFNPPPHPITSSSHHLISPSSPAGFGLAMRTAHWGVARFTGRVLTAPLSGQRAFRAAHLPLLLPLEPGFGLEVGMDIDALRAGLRLLEVPTTMRHAATGRNWAGFRHRGRQWLHIVRALARRSLRSPRRAAAAAPSRAPDREAP